MADRWPPGPHVARRDHLDNTHRPPFTRARPLPGRRLMMNLPDVATIETPLGITLTFPVKSKQQQKSPNTGEQTPFNGALIKKLRFTKCA